MFEIWWLHWNFFLPWTCWFLCVGQQRTDAFRYISTSFYSDRVRTHNYAREMMLLTHLVRTGLINSTVPLPTYNWSSYVKYCPEIMEFKKLFICTYSVHMPFHTALLATLQYMFYSKHFLFYSLFLDSIRQNCSQWRREAELCPVT